MKIITLGMGQNIFEEDSAVRQRMIEYGKIFDELHIIVFSKRDTNNELRVVKLSENVFVYPTNSKIRALYIFDYLKICKKILTSSGSRLATVVSAQDPFELGIVGVILKLIYKLPLQIQVHTDFANRYFITHSPLNLIRFPLGLFVLSFADSVRVVSERIAKSVHSLSHNVSVLPILTSPLAPRSPLLHKEREEGKITFLTVARLEKEKDLVTAIGAFKRALDQGIDGEFVVVGDGKERKSLELKAKSLELENKIRFVGWQDNTERFFREADVYVSTSLYEGYGMSMVEAALHGLPLIISDAGVAGFLFKNEESAFVCRPKDETGFAKAMVRFAQDSNLRLAMGQKAQNMAQQSLISYHEYLQKYRNSLERAVQFFNSGHGIFKKNILLRYLVAGLTGAGTQIGSLYVLTEFAHIWYLYSSILSFVIAMAVSFVLQKFWTFGDREMQKAHYQFAKYLVVAISGIVLNTALMYIQVDILRFWYILAQIIAGAIIAVFNFLMYKFFVFKR